MNTIMSFVWQNEPNAPGRDVRGYPHSSRLAICAPFTIASNFAHTMLAWISSVPAMTFSRPHAALGF